MADNPDIRGRNITLALGEIVPPNSVGQSGTMTKGEASEPAAFRAKNNIEAISYLSEQQLGLLNLSLRSGADPYHIQLAIEFDGPLSVEALTEAWNHTIDRHAILRTDFRWERLPRPVAVTYRTTAPRLDFVDWQEKPEAVCRRALAESWTASRLDGFDFAHAADLRLRLIRVSADRHWLIWRFHHIQLDGWSLSIALADMVAAYADRVGGKRLGSSPAPSFHDYLKWLETRNQNASDDWWDAVLAGADFPTPLPQSIRSSDRDDFAEQVLRLSQEKTSRLVEFGRQHGLTLNTLVQGAWARMLSRYADSNDVTFGMTVSGRPLTVPGVEGMVGTFINTLPLRVKLPPATPILTWLRTLQDLNVDLRDHEQTSLTRLRKRRGLDGGASLFDSILVFENYPLDAGLEQRRIGSLLLRKIDDADIAADHPKARYSDARNHYPLSLIVAPGEAMEFILSYDGRRFNHQTATRLLDELETIMLNLASRPAVPLGEIAYAGETEYAQCEPLAAQNLVSCVGGLAKTRANDLALVQDGSAVSWADLWERSGTLAARLRECGVTKEKVVAISLPRCAELVVGILAVWRAGGAYLPIDPKAPLERLLWQIENSETRWLIAEDATAWCPKNVAVITPDERGARPIGEDNPSPDQLAYVIYTSGSTGRPKGVLVSHGALASYTAAMAARLPDAIRTAAYVSTPAADLGHTALFGALTHGWTLHLISEDTTADPDAFAAYMAENNIDLLKIVPSHLAGMLQAAHPEQVLPGRCLLLGGEASSSVLMGRISALKPNCLVINHYGPTETTVGALTWAGIAKEVMLPLGRPLANSRVDLVGIDGSPVPEGAVGEICIGGASVARGYLNNAAQTADRFVPSPFGPPGSRLYRTGDKGRRNPTGDIGFLGRFDDQIKIRGFRVEPQEVRSRLLSCSGVRDAAVLAHRDGEGPWSLSAYVVGDEVEAEALRQWLASSLPAYMVPTSIEVLQSLPLTANGKIDRSVLFNPKAVPTPRDIMGPRTDNEATLLGIWRDVLKREDISVTDNFFCHRRRLHSQLADHRQSSTGRA